MKLLENNWYPIPGFNGYTINKYGIVKSMKHFNAHPEGMFIKYRHNDGNYYILTDLHNKRVRKSQEQLLKLVEDADHEMGSFTDGEICLGGRNRGFRNYQKFYPSDKGTMKPNIPGQPVVIPDSYPGRASTPNDIGVKLNFESFDKYKKKEPEPMVRFY